VIRGRAPLTVRFNRCQSSDPDQEPDDLPTAGEGDSLNWQFHFGDDGTEPFDDDGTFNPNAEHFCRVEHTYESRGSFVATLSVTDKHLEDQSNGVSAQARVTERISVEVEPGCTVDDGAAPAVTLTSPANGSFFSYFPIPFRASTADDSEVARVDYVGRSTYGGPTFLTLASGSMPSDFAASISKEALTAKFGNSGTLLIKAVAVDRCGNTSESAVISISFFAAPSTLAPAATLGWSGELDVPGSQGQVVLNGGAVSFQESGQAWGLGSVHTGINRIEAQLVRGSGQAGTWRFAFPSDGALKPGSLRVISGEVEELTANGVSFRLNGDPGERIVFHFRVR
jgi:hypothetical protein